MTKHILIFDEDVHTHSWYLQALGHLPFWSELPYQVIYVNRIVDLQRCNAQSIDFVIAALRSDTLVRQLLPRLYRMVQAHRMLLMVDKTVSEGLITYMRSLGSMVTELSSSMAVLHRALAELLEPLQNTRRYNYYPLSMS